MTESTIPRPRLGVPVREPLTRIITAMWLAPRALRPFTGGEGERDTRPWVRH